jgi:hypothetical protein
MTVFELRQALLHVDQSKKVWVTFAKQDERPATCITVDNHYGVHICDTDEEIGTSERVIFNENQKEESNG